MSDQTNFRFYADAFEIIKGKNDKGEDIMKLCGIASREERDSQGEILMIDGMDLSSFIGGFVNWNHSKKAGDVIGQIMNAEKRDKELYIEVELFSELPEAQDAYRLTKILEKRKSKRRMQFSIEGRATSRDTLDKGKVLTSRLTNVALTLNPINGATLAEIQKGEVSFEDSMIEPEFEKAEDANGGKTLIIDVVDDKGNRVTVDDEYNIEVTKAATTVSNAPLIPESVDGEEKNLEYNDKKIKKSFFIEDEIVNFTPSLSKSEVYDFLFKSVSGLDEANAKRLYQTIEFLIKSENNQMAEYTNETLQKAFATLEDLAKINDNLSKGDMSLGNVSAGSKDGGETEPINYMKSLCNKGMSKDEVLKAMKDKYEGMDDEKMEKMYHSNFDKMKKSEESLDEQISKAEADLAALNAKKEELAKSNAAEQPNDEIAKSVEALTSQVNSLVKGFTTVTDTLKVVVGEKEDLQKSLNDANQKLNEANTPRGIQSQGFIKSETAAAQQGTVLSQENGLHRQEILSKADEMIDWGKFGAGDNLEKSFANDVENFKYGKPASAEMISRLGARGISVQ